MKEGHSPTDDLIDSQRGQRISAKDFPKIVEILNEYGKKYPDKVAEFGSSIECMGRGEQEWFGFGCDPQRDAIRPQGNSTFNLSLIILAVVFALLPERQRHGGGYACRLLPRGKGSATAQKP